MKKISIDYLLFGILIGIALTICIPYIFITKKIDVLITSESSATEIIVDGEKKGAYTACVSNLKKGPHSVILKQSGQQEEFTLIISRKGISPRAYGNARFGEAANGFTVGGNVAETSIEITNCTE